MDVSAKYCLYFDLPLVNLCALHASGTKGVAWLAQHSIEGFSGLLAIPPKAICAQFGVLYAAVSHHQEKHDIAN
jgi:hypothetical protein